MQMTQLRAYSKKVPKFDASVMVSSELGVAAICAGDIYPKLDQNPCGRLWSVAALKAPASPNKFDTVRQPSTAEIPASVQMARCGVRFFLCSRPKWEPSSSSLPM